LRRTAKALPLRFEEMKKEIKKKAAFQPLFL